jgi:DNA-binding NtrC family response regulator
MAGFNVLEAASAGEARDIILAGVHVDLVFSDINMPGEFDGLRLALWLHENEFAAPVVLTSGMPSVLADARARCVAVSAFISKPYVYDVVEGQLRQLIAARAKA